MIRTYSLALGSASARLSDVYGDGVGVVNPRNDIPYRSLTLTPSAGAAITVRAAVSPLSYADRVRADGAVAHWRLNDTGATAADVIGGATGTINTGTTKGVAGAIAGDTAMTFDGVAGWIQVPNGPYSAWGTGPLSVELWLKTSLQQPENYLFESAGYWTALNAGVVIYINNASLTASYWSGGSAHAYPQGTPPYFNGQWHHVVTTLRRSPTQDLGQLYFDGALLGEAAMTTPGLSLTSTTPLNIARANAVAGWFTGSLDEVAIYHRELSATEVLQHYQLGQQTSFAAFPLPVTLGPFTDAGPLKLSDLLVSDPPGGSTLTIMGVPF